MGDLLSWFSIFVGLHSIPVVGETVVFLGSLLLGAFTVSAILRPFEKGAQKAKTIETYLGSSCTIISSRVDSGFGEAKIPNPNGAPLLVEVRCDHENGLQRGEEALIVSRDKRRKVLIVEPMK